MKGLYLYCIRNKNGSKFSERGINESEIYVIPYQDLEAVVSEVPLPEFSSEEVQKKAEEDLGWIKKNVQIHENIIEEAMRFNGKILNVIPMKFGTIFNTPKKIEGILKKRYSVFKKSLKKLAGKQEWGVKVYLNPKDLSRETRKLSSVVQEKEKEIARLPEGMAYFAENEVEDIVKKETDKILQDYAINIFETLKQYAYDSAKAKILEKDFTGEPFPMALNAFFLVSEEKLDDFLKAVESLIKEYKSRGFYFKHAGPWPPYHFCF